MPTCDYRLPYYMLVPSYQNSGVETGNYGYHKCTKAAGHVGKHETDYGGLATYLGPPAVWIRPGDLLDPDRWHLMSDGLRAHPFPKPEYEEVEQLLVPGWMPRMQTLLAHLKKFAPTLQYLGVAEWLPDGVERYIEVTSDQVATWSVLPPSIPKDGFFVSLHNGPPDSDQTVNELSFAGYARQELTEGIISFPQCGPGTNAKITHYAIGTKSFGPSKVLYWNPLTPLLIDEGVVVQFQSPEVNFGGVPMPLLDFITMGKKSAMLGKLL